LTFTCYLLELLLLSELLPALLDDDSELLELLLPDDAELRDELLLLDDDAELLEGLLLDLAVLVGLEEDLPDDTEDDLSERLLCITGDELLEEEVVEDDLRTSELPEGLDDLLLLIVPELLLLCTGCVL
jgi:hypothetical protein